MIQIVDAKPVHVGILAGQLTADERAVFAVQGCDARRVLRGFFRQSSYRRTALIDGRPIALWGITGSLFSSTGILWLRLADVARKLPRLVVEQGREELARMLDVRRELVIYVPEQDYRALRFAEFFGFEFGNAVTFDGIPFVARRGVVSRR